MLFQYVLIHCHLICPTAIWVLLIPVNRLLYEGGTVFSITLHYSAKGMKTNKKEITEQGGKYFVKLYKNTMERVD